MNNFILIETTAEICSAALATDNQIVLNYISSDTMNHAKLLPIYLKEIIDYVHTNNISIDAVCISEGPGSYTGLRIGCSTAKGLCYALKCKLLSISTLKLIARITKEKYNITHGYICPCIDARRMEVYTSLYNNNLDEILPATATILNDEFLIQYSLKDIIYICGNGAEKCNKLNLNNNYNIITDIIPTADKMLMLATEEYNKSHFKDIAYYEPFYLKEFQATTPSNKLFNLINGK